MNVRDMARPTPVAVLALAALLVAAAPGPTGHAAEADADWIAAWGAPMSSTSDVPEDSTVRNIARITLGGTAVRVRLSNALDEETPLVVGAASIALQRDAIGPAIVPGSSRPITFGGERGVTVPPGTDFVYSDPVRFPVEALDNVAVSLYLPKANPGASTSNFNTSYHTNGGAGDQTEEDTGAAFGNSIGSTYALTAIDVLTDEADGAVVGLGSSSTQGTGTTRDAYERFLDRLSVRINENIDSGDRKGIVGAGIGGDTLNASLASRFDRDVLTQSGVEAVILWNINDLFRGRSATQIIDDYRIAIERSHQRGIRVLCPTWPPASHSLVREKPTQERSKLNAWILNSGECDDVVDWDAVLRDDVLGDTYRPQYQADTIHFNGAGHSAIAEATPLRWFTAPSLCPDKKHSEQADETHECSEQPPRQ